MKRSSLICSVFILLFTLSAATVYAGPEGIQNIQWGDSADKLIGKQVVKKQGDLAIYKQGESIAKYEGIATQGTVYVFLDDQLVSVMMLISDETAARKQLRKIHGASLGSDTASGISAMWVTGDTVLALMVDPQANVKALVLLTTRAITEEKMMQRLTGAFDSLDFSNDSILPSEKVKSPSSIPTKSVDRSKTKSPTGTVWKSNQVLGANGDHPFAGIYHFDSLTIGDNVEITSSGISQLVIKVQGELVFGDNAVIRVRNGYYPGAPQNPISGINSKTLRELGIDGGGFRVFENTFGRGGNGGNGGPGSYGPGTVLYLGLGKSDTIGGLGGNGGGGGGGGFGGGQGGQGGKKGGGTHKTVFGQKAEGFDGSNGANNGGNGGYGVGSTGGLGGGGKQVGSKGKYDSNAGSTDGGSGGGGNGAPGLAGLPGIRGDGNGGGGGGGGGYGGGVLTIIADKITFNPLAPPRFIVSGQLGGKGGLPNGKVGENGEGGLLIIECPDYNYSPSHWQLGAGTFGNHDSNVNNGGHGIVTGNPQKVFINGKDVSSL